MKFIMISDVRVRQLQETLERHGETEQSDFLKNALQPSSQIPLRVSGQRPREVFPRRVTEVGRQ